MNWRQLILMGMQDHQQLNEKRHQLLNKWYDQCSKWCKKMYEEKFSEKVFIKNMNKIMKTFYKKYEIV